jgi:hypothetical protein
MDPLRLLTAAWPVILKIAIAVSFILAANYGIVYAS